MKIILLNSWIFICLTCIAQTSQMNNNLKKVKLQYAKDKNKISKIYKNFEITVKDCNCYYSLDENRALIINELDTLKISADKIAPYLLNTTIFQKFHVSKDIYTNFPLPRLNSVINEPFLLELDNNKDAYLRRLNQLVGTEISHNICNEEGRDKLTQIIRSKLKADINFLFNLEIPLLVLIVYDLSKYEDLSIGILEEYDEYGLLHKNPDIFFKGKPLGVPKIIYNELFTSRIKNPKYKIDINRIYSTIKLSKKVGVE